MKSLVAIIVFTGLWFSALPASADAVAAADWSDQPSALTIKLSTDRSSYRVGDDIRVKVVLQNTTSEIVRDDFAPAYLITDLKVADSAGHQLIRPKGRPNRGFIYSGRSSGIRPGMSLVLTDWNKDYKSVTPWTPVAYWGYDITKTGTYTLTVFRRFQGGFVATSNPMTITIK